jgi:hypothetical protein
MWGLAPAFLEAATAAATRLKVQTPAEILNVVRGRGAFCMVTIGLSPFALDALRFGRAKAKAATRRFRAQ